MDETAALDELATRMWDERHLLTVLLYRLTVARLLLAADERRFTADAVHEVDRTVAQLREEEERRDTALRDLAEAWEVDPATLSLPEVARRAPTPYDHTFDEHLSAFRSMTDEIEQLARTNRTLAQAAMLDLSATLDQLTGADPAPATTYDATGQLDPAGPVGGRLREAL